MTADPKRPNAAVMIKTGDQVPKGQSRKLAPNAWDHGAVMERSGGDWRPHPAFRSHEAGGEQSFTIEIISNVVQKNLQSHLSMYAGKTKFCCRAHRGDDGIGVAMRRTQDGSRVAVECNPDRCNLRKLHLARNDETAIVKQAIRSQDFRAFPYLAAQLKNEPAACKPDCNLVFALVTPDGGYAHGPGEFAVFHSTSDVNHGRFHETLMHLYRQCHGNLIGLRLQLEYEPFNATYGLLPAWSLRVPEDASFEQQQIAAAQRRKAGRIDYDALVAAADEQSLAVIGNEKNLASVAADMGIELADLVRQGMDDEADLQGYMSEYIDIRTVNFLNHDPLVIRMAERLNLAYPYLVRMPIKHGNDLHGAMQWLRTLAQRSGIFIDDIWGDYTGSPVELTARPVEVADEQDAVENATEPQDAEFTEIEGDDTQAEVKAQDDAPVRSLDEMMNAARGKTQDEEQGV